MNSLGLCFAGTGADPACRVRIDGMFPDFYGIQFMNGGSMVFQRNAVPGKEFAHPCFFWTDRKSRYRYGPGSSGSWNHRWIAISGRVMDTYYRPLLEDLAPDGAILVAEPRAVLSAFLEFLEAWNSGDSAKRLHRLNHLLDAVDRHRILPGAARDALALVKSAIDADPCTERDFSKIARAAGYSYSSFRRLFRARFRCSPHRYVLDRRFHLAAHLLSTSGEPVQSIGHLLGYDDPAQFSRAFKLRFGTAPINFRRKARVLQPSDL